MAAIRVVFPNRDGENLAGLLEMPASGTARAFALFAHCFTCTKNLSAARNISRALAAEGFGVLRFDFAGLGDSEGDFAATNFSSNMSDLVCAAEFLGARYQAPQLLVGHSLGGAAVLYAASAIPSAVAVATVGAPADARHVAHLLDDNHDEIVARGEVEVTLAGRPFTVRKQFLDDLEQQPMPETLRALRRALLVMHAPLDEVVAVSNATEIFANALHPKSFVSLDDADHLLSDERDSRYAGSVIAAWAHRYVSVLDESSAPGAAEGEVAARTHMDGFRTDVVAGGHRLLADEPTALGGTNLGPSPYGLLSAALATCTSMTLKMYAGHKNLPMKWVDVFVTHNKVHAEDCAGCEQDAGARIDVFERRIRIEGPLSEQQRNRMIEIADRCPVHRSLESENRISTSLIAE